MNWSTTVCISLLWISLPWHWRPILLKCAQVCWETLVMMILHTGYFEVSYIYIYVYIERGLQLWQHYACRFSLWVRDAGLAFFKPRKHCHIWWLMIYLTLSSEEILVSLARNPKLIGPQTFADKIWVVPVKLLCISMFNISKIGHKSILGPVKAKKNLWHMHSAPVSKFKHFQ